MSRPTPFWCSVLGVYTLVTAAAVGAILWTGLTALGLVNAAVDNRFDDAAIYGMLLALGDLMIAAQLRETLQKIRKINKEAKEETK